MYEIIKDCIYGKVGKRVTAATYFIATSKERREYFKLVKNE